MAVGAILTPLLPIISNIIDRVVPNPTEKAKLQLELAKLEQELMVGQIEVNKVEAGHRSIFVAGWRPAVGWIGAIGVGYSFVVEPMASWAAKVIFGYQGAFPALSTGDLMWLVAGMLGFGTVRAVEKINGVAREQSPLQPAQPTPAPKPKKGLDLWPF